MVDASIHERIGQLARHHAGFEVNSEEEALAVIEEDSMKAIEFIVVIEDEFEVELEDEVFGKDFFGSVASVVACLEEAMRSKPECAPHNKARGS